MDDHFTLMRSEIRHKIEQEVELYKLQANQHISHLVTEDRFQETIQKYTNLKDYEYLMERMKELNQLVCTDVKPSLMEKEYRLMALISQKADTTELKKLRQ